MKKAAGRTRAALSPPTQGNGGAAGQGRRHQSPALVTGHPFLHAHCTTTVFRGCASRASPFPPHCRENTPGGQNAGGGHSWRPPRASASSLRGAPPGKGQNPSRKEKQTKGMGLDLSVLEVPGAPFLSAPPNTSRPPGTTAAPQPGLLARNLLREQRFHRPSQSHRLWEAKEIK